MITGISIVSVWVLDQDSAKEFYADKLGFTVTNDITLEGGMRWLTVRPPGNPGPGAAAHGSAALHAR